MVRPSHQQMECDKLKLVGSDLLYLALSRHVGWPFSLLLLLPLLAYFPSTTFSPFVTFRLCTTRSHTFSRPFVHPPHPTLRRSIRHLTAAVVFTTLALPALYSCCIVELPSRLVCSHSATMATAEEETMVEGEEVIGYEDILKLQELGVNAQDVKRLKEAGHHSTHCTHCHYRLSFITQARPLMCPSLLLRAVLLLLWCRHSHRARAVHGNKEGALTRCRSPPLSCCHSAPAPSSCRPLSHAG